jgi:hypothetical protein
MAHFHQQDQIRTGAKLMPNFRVVENTARAKRLIDYPKRYTLAIRAALRSCKLRHWEQVEFWNADYEFTLGDEFMEGGNQFIDFLVYAKGTPRRALAVLIKNPASLSKPAEKVRWLAKVTFIRSQGIPLVIVPVEYSSQEYAVVIQNEIRKLKR